MGIIRVQQGRVSWLVGTGDRCGGSLPTLDITHRSRQDLNACAHLLLVGSPRLHHHLRHHESKLSLAEWKCFRFIWRAKRCIFRWFYVEYDAVSIISFTFSRCQHAEQNCCSKQHQAATSIETDSALASENSTVEKMRPIFDGHPNRLLKVTRI